LRVAALTTIRPLAQAEASSKERRFSVRDWLSEQSGLPRTIILQHNAEYPLLSTAIGGLLVDVVCGKLLSPSMPKRDRPRSAAHRLSAEQAFAAEAATRPNAVVVIEGAPGSGKSTTLAPIVEAWQTAGHRVIGTATAWRVARALQRDLNIEARATASWVERLRTGERFLDEKSILIVDEAGLLSSREALALLSEVERAQAKVILVGDRRQLQAIGAGPGLDLVVRALRQRVLTPLCASATPGRGRP
jgi:AAA domain/Type IV secretion-system coupling protein DNA-binding domain